MITSAKSASETAQQSRTRMIDQYLILINNQIECAAKRGLNSITYDIGIPSECIEQIKKTLVSNGYKVNIRYYQSPTDILISWDK